MATVYMDYLSRYLMPKTLVNGSEAGKCMSALNIFYDTP